MHSSWRVLATLSTLSTLSIGAGGLAAQAQDAAEARNGVEPGAERSRLEAPLVGTGGEVVGAVSVEQLEGDGVRVWLYAEGLEPGPHAVHFHETGVCEPPDFASAGGHFDPAGARHGKPGTGDLGTTEHHAGDMLNQRADERGIIDATLINRTVNLDRGRHQLLDNDGTALVIHAQPDDYQTQPAGDAGERIACAVIR